MTNILYHLTTLPPRMPACEALSQEIAALRAHFGGDLVFLNPNQGSPIYLPRIVFGLHQLRDLRAREARFDLHHLYNPDPFPFLVLRGLQRPVVYTVSSGIGHRRPNLRFFSSLAAVTVYDERSLGLLKSWGLTNVFLVQSGIAKTRFTVTPAPLAAEIRLMVGSAPWTEAQFRTKGVDALLAAAQQDPRLHLIFLWRGVLAEEVQSRVQQLELGQRVTVVNEQVDVNQVLADVHASITLATDQAIIKAFPHSLMESLAAGKPVIVSRAIPMSAYVEQKGCGKVVDNVAPTEILAAIDALVADYASLQEAARQAGQRDFALEGMIDSYKRVYDAVLAKRSGP
jgi:glycosyltransferase involved in cell wall biosynthesis